MNGPEVPPPCGGQNTPPAPWALMIGGMDDTIIGACTLLKLGIVDTLLPPLRPLKLTRCCVLAAALPYWEADATDQWPEM